MEKSSFASIRRGNHFTKLHHFTKELFNLFTKPWEPSIRLFVSLSRAFRHVSLVGHPLHE
jgi:hypothetical protein